MTPMLRRLAWAAQPIFIGVVLWWALGGSGRDYRVPLAFQGDALLHLAQARATIDTGWWWTNPSIGAPSVHNALLFPPGGNVDQVFVRVVGLLWPEAASAVTMAWFVMIMLSGLSAAWCLRRLGVSEPGAWVSGALFALSPFAFYRHTAHFNLMPYLVPFAATAALTLATRPTAGWRARGWLSLLVGLVLLGFNEIYYAFFSAFFVGVGAIAGVVRHRRVAHALAGGTAVGAIVLAALITLAPTVAAWQRDGRPDSVQHSAADSELYALKVRHLVSPLPDHWFPPFRAWDARNARAGFPNETENVGSRLGLVATLGFLGLILALIVPRIAGDGEHAETIRSCAQFVLAAILLATVGGLGSVFSVIVSPYIRSYTRITPFIAFFSLAAIALVVDRATLGRPWHRRAVLAGLLTVGLLDQTVGARPLNTAGRAIAIEFRELRTMIDLVEPQLPPQAMVFQLPIRPYPTDRGVEQMAAYDHLKVYIASRRLRWSYPALSRREIAQQAATAAIEAGDLPAYLARQGFAAIVLDKFGYKDRGLGVLAALQTIPSHAQVIDETGRYLTLDLSQAAVARGGR